MRTPDVDLKFRTCKVREKWRLPTILDFFVWGFYMYMKMCTVYMIFFNVRHSETQFSWQVLAIFLDPKIRQLHFPGG